jgi:plasmid replication initiation protein
MKNKPNLNAMVVKHNDLIGQMAKFELSELRLIAYCLAHYDSRKPENTAFIATVEDLTAVFPMDRKSAYAVVRKAMLGVNRKPLEIETEKDQQFWNWFSGFSYRKGEGEFTFHLTPQIQPYLLKLSGSFTRYRLQDVYQFKAASTWKLYERLKRWAAVKKWSVGLDELRLLLGVAGKYPRWDNLKNRLLDFAIEEINKSSDLTVTFEKEKCGRQVSGLVFFIDKKKLDSGNVIEMESGQDRLLKELLGQGVNATTATRYIDEVVAADKVGRITEILPKLAERAKRADTPTAKYILGAIKNELRQGNLFAQEPVYKESLDCWIKKRQGGEVCKVRQRGTAGQRKKCQTCLTDLPLEQMGI